MDLLLFEWHRTGNILLILMPKLVPIDTIINKIVIFRGEKVIIDRDLAELYGVTTKALNQAVKRNKARFPSDFMFRLTKKVKLELVTNCDRFTAKEKQAKYGKRAKKN